MNANKKRNSEFIVIWNQEEKKFKTVEELDKFIIEKSLNSIENRKILILYKGYEIEYDFDNGEFSCKSFRDLKTPFLYEITDEIDEKIDEEIDEEIEKKNNKSKIIQSMDREI